MWDMTLEASQNEQGSGQPSISSHKTSVPGSTLDFSNIVVTLRFAFSVKRIDCGGRRISKRSLNRIPAP